MDNKILKHPVRLNLSTPRSQDLEFRSPKEPFGPLKKTLMMVHWNLLEKTQLTTLQKIKILPLLSGTLLMSHQICIQKTEEVFQIEGVTKRI